MLVLQRLVLHVDKPNLYWDSSQVTTACEQGRAPPVAVSQAQSQPSRTMLSNHKDAGDVK
jgi:hypothetical protein